MMTDMTKERPPSSQLPATPLSAAEWSSARGDKWNQHRVGMEATIAPVDEPLIQALDLAAPCRIADIGCGGGATTMKISRRAPAGSTVHGFDISQTMVAGAQARIPPGEFSVAFHVADVAQAPAPAQPYERLASRFGIMFFDDPPAAFANLAHWLMPGGRFAFAVWGDPAQNPCMTAVGEVLADFLTLPKPDRAAPGPFRYADPEKFCSLLDQAGFSEMEVRDWRGTLPTGGGLPAAEAAHFVLSAFGSYGDQLKQAGDTVFDEAHQALTARYSRHMQDGIVQLDAYIHVICGNRQ